jgi:hypothetical protein
MDLRDWILFCMRSFLIGLSVFLGEKNGLVAWPNCFRDKLFVKIQTAWAFVLRPSDEFVVASR